MPLIQAAFFSSLARQLEMMFVTYVLAGHTLADDLGVLVDEDVGASLISVDTTGGGDSHDRAGSLQEILGNGLGQHLLLIY